MPFCPTGQVFWLEYNVVVFAPKLTDSIFSGPRKRWKTILKEKKNSCKIWMKVPLVSIGQEFRHNAISPFLPENLSTVYLEVLETSGKF